MMFYIYIQEIKRWMNSNYNNLKSVNTVTVTATNIVMLNVFLKRSSVTIKIQCYMQNYFSKQRTCDAIYKLRYE